jgi:Co/Zn/Cd efflux system component
MTFMTDVKVTTEILWKGALFFALIDIVFVVVVTRLIKPADFHQMKWKLVAFMAIFFCGLFGIIVSSIFWDSVYSFVFPVWARWIIPPVYGLLFASYGLLVWWLSFRLRTNAVMNFCFFGGLWGIITHIGAIHGGILKKPPMLQGADPIAALVIAAFEFIFYWCVCLSIAFFIQQIEKRIR